MILSFKKFDNLLLYLSLKVGVSFRNSQHLRLKWHFEKLDKYGPWLSESGVLTKRDMQNMQSRGVQGLGLGNAALTNRPRLPHYECLRKICARRFTEYS